MPTERSVPHLAPLWHGWLRRLCYSRPLFGLTRLLQPAAQHEQPDYWDAALAGPMVDYLGDTRSVIQSNAIVVALLRIFGQRLRRVLDVGCAGGTLAYDLPPEAAYVGIDISAVAIADAVKRRDSRPPRPAPVLFQRAAIGEYDLQGEEFDAVVLSEILYYLTPDTAREQAVRYAQSTSRGGVIVVSMKQDAKSSLIFRLIQRHLTFCGGILYQPKHQIDFRVRPSYKSPAFLVGAFKLPSPASAQR